MRNLKKILALVLALVMSLSVMATANAAFSDEAAIDAGYAEAIEVLSGLKVFQGEGGAFKPTANISRQEFAAILYRVISGDVADKQTNLYVEGAKFSDVASTSWAAGYIGYCANGNYIKGYDGKFDPQGEVTGYAALAMILRAIGYDKNGEFTGSDWEKNVATTAQQIGMLNGIAATVNLRKAVSREVVAQILFNGILANKVEYTPAFGYQATTINYAPSTIAADMFGLVKGARDTIDAWGRPGYKWFSKGVAIATIEEKAVASYTNAVAECTVAHDTKVDADKNYALFVNGKTAIGNYMVNALDTVTTIGAQGRLTEVYSDRIVMVDTFLAKVAAVVPAAYDAAGHLRTPSSITLNVYDAADQSTAALTLTNGTTNYTWKVNDVVLVNAYTASNSATASGDVIVDTTKYGVILGAAEAFQGTQSILWWYAGQHTVNNTLYNDAAEFHLNQAGNDVAAHTWYKDQYGNLIGVVDIATQYAFGVIESIWWADDATTGGGKALANVVYLDGSKNTVQLAAVTVNTANAGSNFVKAYGVVTPSGNAAAVDMTIVDGKFYVDQYAANNKAADTNGIIADNLFRFQTLSNGTVTAYEVGGVYGNGDFVVDADDETTITKGISANGDLLINEDTQFFIRSGAGTAASPYTWTLVTGYTNIASYQNGEVDFINNDLDPYAEIVYITAAPTTAKTSSLFYLTSLNVYEQRLLDGITVDYYVLGGYVDGVAGSIKIAAGTAGEALVQQFIPGWTPAGGTPSANYTNRMFIVEIENGYVDDVIYDGPAANGVINSWIDSDHLNATYTGLSLITIEGAADDTWNGTVYYDASAGIHYTVYGITPVNGGAWAANMSGKNVTLVYKGTTVVAAYIVDKAAQAVDSKAIASANVTIDTLNKGYDLPATATINTLVDSDGNGMGADKKAATKASLTWYKLNESTGVYELYTGAVVPGYYKYSISLSTTAKTSAGLAYTVATDVTVVATNDAVITVAP